MASASFGSYETPLTLIASGTREITGISPHFRRNFCDKSTISRLCLGSIGNICLAICWTVSNITIPQRTFGFASCLTRTAITSIIKILTNRQQIKAHCQRTIRRIISIFIPTITEIISLTNTCISSIGESITILSLSSCKTSTTLKIIHILWILDIPSSRITTF